MKLFQKQIMNTLFGIVLASSLIGCASPVVEEAGPTQTFVPTTEPFVEVEQPAQLSPKARAAREYLESAFDIIEEDALNSDQVDWEDLREEVFTRQQGVTDISAQHIQIEYILTKLNDHHSTFMTPQEAKEIFWEAPLEYAPIPKGNLTAGQYGYIWMGGFGSADPEVMNAYASILQQIVKDLDAQSPCAWVVDLRDNTGGNMQPMVAGLGELIGDGLIGQGINRQGKVIFQGYYKDGGYWSDGEVIAQASDPDFELQHKNLPIIILIGPNTMSAGEMLAVSFRGNPNAKLIGHETIGLTTGKGLYELSDGAVILLTVTLHVDPTGQVYGGKVTPDVLLEGNGVGSSVERETIPGDVLDWLAENVVCEK